jgi:hypothetical protein
MLVKMTVGCGISHKKLRGFGPLANYADIQIQKHIYSLFFKLDRDHSLTSVICFQMATPLQIFVLKCLYFCSYQYTLRAPPISFGRGGVYYDIVTGFLRARIVEPNGTTVARQRPVNNSEVVFSVGSAPFYVRSVPRLYSENHHLLNWSSSGDSDKCQTRPLVRRGARHRQNSN